MEIRIKQSTIILPAKETPKHFLPSSDLDLVAPAVYVPTVLFYRPRTNHNSSNFFEARRLKESLSNVLVSFYPIAGRLRKDENGRIEIDCNGGGILFMEAEANCDIDDLGDFSQGFKLLPLVPTVDHTKEASSHPLMVTQVTYFKCGGACLGVRLHHILVDGVSKSHFINTWADVTRGLPVKIQPFFDRNILTVGVPTSPTFHHTEYDPPPSMNTPDQNLQSHSNPESISTAILKLSLDQILTLKEKCKTDHESTIKYSRFEIIAAHIWRCVCKARGLSDDQVTKLHNPTSGRSRLNPPVPSGYFGNVIFTATSIAFSGDIQSEPLNCVVDRIHNALKKMDDKYLKSALSYLKQQFDPRRLGRGANTFKSPNLNIVDLVQMPMYNADFGWGKPFFVRPVNTYFEGISHILPSPTDDGSLSVIINLETQHMQLFKKFFYEIFLQHQNTRSRY
ncbi:Hydroxycinnamoyl-CoA shikimate/quinate hydroxycinnamoyl transferase [Melia azedarach]|uniref:Hydroxycinnamoyl-CoA shikimate/quinate hydroxycinnamoyl transferase n=1 Tax=Melia azedarach TaxID=155640 RepID=A0ACC1XE48_MELAZ|nr:Hydroxycinnamoyl-CoA shikimate/quinate hydroxycinnamoyl transferase [Melia azedarach]